MTVPFGKEQLSVATVAAPSGSTRIRTVGVGFTSFLLVAPALQVEAEVADVGAAGAIHHHVVAVERRQLPQIGVQRQRAVRLEPQHAAIQHRDDQQAAVGKPAESGRLLRNLDDSFQPGVFGNREHGVLVEIREPQAAVVPARPFAEPQTVKKTRVDPGMLRQVGRRAVRRSSFRR